MKRWLKYVKPYKKYFILGPLCMIIEVIGEVLMPKFLAGIINDAATAPEVSYIVLSSVLMIVTAIIMMLGGVGGAWFGAKAAINFAGDLREDIYSKVQKFSFANLDKFSTGSLVTRLTNDVTQLQNFVNMLLRMCLRSPGMLIGGLIMAIAMNAQLAIVLAVAIPIIATVQVIVIKKGFGRFGRMQTKIDALNSTVQENLTNVRVVKSFVREDFEREKFSEANSDLKNAGMSAMKVMIMMMPILTLVMNLSSLAVIWFGGKQVIVGEMLLGDLTAFLTYITQILMSLMMLTMLFINSSRALASAKRIKEVLDEKIDLNDDNALCKDKKVEQGRIEFRNVSFRYYKNSEEKVLDSISFSIESGKTVGIIGSTGCGKTTLVSMIPRLYDVDEGEVLVDGVNVKYYSLVSLREGVSMVLQKNVLFSGTIEENLRWGDEDATQEELEAAARSAQAHSFIESFSDGYSTELEQGGVNVSGGQKQRLCIARALLNKPKILILDDSTSAVDTATEAHIRRAFATELGGTTKIIIAQRISSVIDADEIIVMDDGRITGIGTHEELIKSNTEYKEIYSSQMDSREVG